MPTPLHYLALPLLFAASPALAQSAFDGTWKADLSTASVQGKPDSFRIKDGVYSCSSCIPAYSVPADGGFHPVKGKDYWDEVAITVVDDHNAKFSFRKAGKVISDNSYTVSADGATLSGTSRNTNNGGSVPIDSAFSETRIGAPVPGAHLISGDWKPAPATSMSDAALTMQIAVKDGMYHGKMGLGESLDARIGGGYALNTGDPGKTMTKVEQAGAKSLRFTDLRGGKVVQTSSWTIGDDGKLHGSWKDPQSGASGTWVATKQ